MNQDDLITGKEAAKMLKCSYPYLFDLIDAGVLHRVPQRTLIGSKRKPLRFRRRDIEQLARETGKLDEAEDKESHAIPC